MTRILHFKLKAQNYKYNDSNMSYNYINIEGTKLGTNQGTLGTNRGQMDKYERKPKMLGTNLGTNKGQMASVKSLGEGYTPPFRGGCKKVPSESPQNIKNFSITKSKKNECRNPKGIRGADQRF